MNCKKRDPWVWTLSLTSLVWAFTAALFPVCSRAADTTTLTVTAYIDGRDLLIVQGSTLQWHHLDYAAVGRFLGANVPTTISTTLNGAVVMDNLQWTPDWPFPPPNELRFEAFSSAFAGLAPALPSADATVTLSIIQARGSVTIFQSPSAANGYTLIVDFNDDPEGGPATYEVELTITTGNTPAGYGCYRFENGTPGTVAAGSSSILDSCYGNEGTPVGAPTYSSDVPSIGAPNSVSLQFNGGSDAITFDTEFPFNQPGIDVSLDFWLKVTPTANQSVFWTRPDSVDSNRFEFFVNANGTFGFDYRDPNGALHSLVGDPVASTGIAIASDTWTRLNVTRVGNQYFTRENGTLVATATDGQPNLPTDVGWMISGRSGHPFAGLVDEVGVTFVPTPVQLSSSSLTFPTQAVGTTSAPQIVSLMNTGSQPVAVSSVTIIGGNSSDFAQTNTCTGSLSVGATCTITVTFTPAGVGDLIASVMVVDNATTSPQNILLAGTGTAAPGPAVSLSTSNLQFGGEPIGTTSATQNVTLTNVGTESLNISSIALSGANSGDFAQSNNCPATVAVNANCVISVTFTPTASGIRTASVKIADNASNSPQIVSLSGTGTAPAVTVSSTALSFAAQLVGTTSVPQTVTLTNSGTGPLTISSLALTGTNSSDFPETNTCPISPSTLAAGSNCKITVNFKPSAVGSRTASVTITDNASGSPHVISLGGTAIGRPSLSAKITSQSKNGTQLTLVLNFSNVGSDTARNTWVKQIALRTLGGTGTVTYVSPSLPLNLGSLAVGGSSPCTFQFNVPATVTKFSVSESGTMQDTAGNTYSYSLGQVVFP